VTALSIVDALALLATLAAALFIALAWKNIPRDVAVLFTMILVVVLYRNLSNLLESAAITNALDTLEDNAEVFLPVFWGFLLYALGQQVDKKARADLTASLAMRNQELQSIVYVASHDLRSPLVNVRGFSNELASSCSQLAELLDNPDPDEETRTRIAAILKEEIPECLGFIEAGAGSMDRIIDGLLKLSRAGAEEIDIHPLDMNHLILGIRQALSYQIEQKHAAFTLGDLPPCLGDESQVAQLFSNLIDNAIKYLDNRRPGRIAVTGWQELDRAVYCVTDNGIGIAPEDHEKVFGVFCRLHPDKPTPGEGLGLNIVSRILERHHGTIRLESKPGQGAAFYVSLPRP